MYLFGLYEKALKVVSMLFFCNMKKNKKNA